MPINKRSPLPVSIGKKPFRSIFGLTRRSIIPSTAIDPNMAIKKIPLGHVQYIHPKVCANQFILYTLPKAKPFAM